MKIPRLQAIKALKEEGIDTVVINPNVATVQVRQYAKAAKYAKQVTKKRIMRFLIECAMKTNNTHGIVCNMFRIDFYDLDLLYPLRQARVSLTRSTFFQ